MSDSHSLLCSKRKGILRTRTNDLWPFLVTYRGLNVLGPSDGQLTVFVTTFKS